MSMHSHAVNLAKESLTYYIEEGQVLPLPQAVPEELKKPAGVFVSLKKGGKLRGCIGTFLPTRKSAAEEIIHNAVSAGTQDPRFMPVTQEELGELVVSVDLLEAPEAVAGLGDLNPGKYGVIVKSGPKTGLLLPMLEGIDTPEEQVAIAKEKAGIIPGEEVALYRFTVTRYV